jgi:hypothetical protein
MTSVKIYNFLIRETTDTIILTAGKSRPKPISILTSNLPTVLRLGFEIGTLVKNNCFIWETERRSKLFVGSLSLFELKIPKYHLSLSLPHVMVVVHWFSLSIGNGSLHSCRRLTPLFCKSDMTVFPPSEKLHLLSLPLLLSSHPVILRKHVDGEVPHNGGMETEGFVGTPFSQVAPGRPGYELPEVSAADVVNLPVSIFSMVSLKIRSLVESSFDFKS